MYQKANILLSLERCDEALKNLEQLKEIAPRESSIYALMGKTYKRLNMHEKAMFYFGVALDLNPPAADVATIKVLHSEFDLWVCPFILLLLSGTCIYLRLEVYEITTVLLSIIPI